MRGQFDIPLEWYNVFCAVAKAGNMSQAAESLYLSQPAVSMAIKQLEERLGHPLFIRTARGVTLTPEGLMLNAYLEKALGIIDAAERKYLEMTHLEAGAIAIGASDTLCSQYLLSYLEEYNKLYPHIGIKVTNRTSPETLEIVKSGEVDFGFVSLPVVVDGSMEVQQCLQIHDCLICGSKFSSMAEKGLTISELCGRPLLMLEKTSATRRYLDSYALESNVTLKPIIELGSSDLLVKFARINLGLAFVIREFAKESIDGETLFEVPLTPPPPARAVGMVKLKNLPLSYAAQRFIDLIVK